MSPGRRRSGVPPGSRTCCRTAPRRASPAARRPAGGRRGWRRCRPTAPPRSAAVRARRAARAAAGGAPPRARRRAARGRAAAAPSSVVACTAVDSGPESRASRRSSAGSSRLSPRAQADDQRASLEGQLGRRPVEHAAGRERLAVDHDADVGQAQRRPDLVERLRAARRPSERPTRDATFSGSPRSPYSSWSTARLQPRAQRQGEQGDQQRGRDAGEHDHQAGVRREDEPGEQRVGEPAGHHQPDVEQLVTQHAGGDRRRQQRDR